jgi:hypothetical protein
VGVKHLFYLVVACASVQLAVCPAHAQGRALACGPEVLAVAERLRAYEACSQDNDSFSCTPLFAEIASSAVVRNLTGVVGYRAVAEMAIPRVPQIFRQRLERMTNAAIQNAERTLRGSITTNGLIAANRPLILQVTLRNGGPANLNLRTGQIIAQGRVQATLGGATLTELRRQAAQNIMNSILTQDVPAIRADGALLNAERIMVQRAGMSFHTSVNGVAAHMQSVMQIDRQEIVYLTRDLVRQQFARNLPLGMRFALLRAINFRSLFSPRALIGGLPSMALSVASPLLGGGYRLACSADDVLSRLGQYPANREIAMADFRAGFQATDCQAVMTAWNAMKQISVSDLQCDNGSARFHLEHHRDNHNFCAGNGGLYGEGASSNIGERIFTPVQVLFNARSFEPSTVSFVADDLGTRLTNWGNARWRDVNRNAPHHLQGKVSGVMAYVMQECRNRVERGYTPLARLDFGRERMRAASGGTSGTQGPSAVSQ